MDAADYDCPECRDTGQRTCGVYDVAWGDYAASCRYVLKHKRGGDPAEWPEELRVRDFPTAHLTRGGGQ